LGGGCAAAGSLGGFSVAFGLPFVLTGSGSGSGGFWGFGSFGVFFAISERVQKLRKNPKKKLCLVDRMSHQSACEIQNTP
jgi:nitrate/nitrite transporter NarK